MGEKGTGSPFLEVIVVPTYIMLSTLTESGAETLREHPDRLKEVNREIEAMGVKVVQQYAVLGPLRFGQHRRGPRQRHGGPGFGGTRGPWQRPYRDPGGDSDRRFCWQVEEEVTSADGCERRPVDQSPCNARRRGERRSIRDTRSSSRSQSAVTSASWSGPGGRMPVGQDAPSLS